MSEVVVPSFKWVPCPLQVGNEFLLQAEEFKCLGVVFMRKERRMRVTGAALGL